MTTVIDETAEAKSLANPPHSCRPAPKWAAVVNDQLVPMPRPVVPVSHLKHEARVAEGFVLLRDHNSPNDPIVADAAEVNLADGNVFRSIPRCEAAPTHVCPAPPKLAFVVDDGWKITINPAHSEASLRQLFGLNDDVELLRLALHAHFCA